jgi:hypothetical protein
MRRKMPFQVDGELRESQQDDCDGLWPHSPKAGDLDIHHRLPGLSVGLAASLRSMPTACWENSYIVIRRLSDSWTQSESRLADNMKSGKAKEAT